MAIKHTSPAGLKVKDALNALGKRVSKNTVIERMEPSVYSVNDKLWVNVKDWTYGNIKLEKVKSKTSKKSKSKRGRPKGSKNRKKEETVVEGETLEQMILRIAAEEGMGLKDSGQMEVSQSQYRDNLDSELEHLDGFAHMNRHSDLYSNSFDSY
jgi:hypothetical protein